MWAKDNMNHWFMSSLTAMARNMEGNLLMGPKLYLYHITFNKKKELGAYPNYAYALGLNMDDAIAKIQRDYGKDEIVVLDSKLLAATDDDYNNGKVVPFIYY